MHGIGRLLTNLWRDQSGISSVEYALMLSFVAGAIITAAGDLSNAVGNEMSDAASCVDTGGQVC